MHPTHTNLMELFPVFLSLHPQTVLVFPKVTPEPFKASFSEISAMSGPEFSQRTKFYYILFNSCSDYWNVLLLVPKFP